MQDCLKALSEAKGKREEAEKLLKEWGHRAAEKRAARETREGAVFIHEEGGSAAMVEFVCETDFVSRNASFMKAGAEAARHAWAAMLEAPDAELKDLAAGLGGVMKENIGVRRVASMKAGPCGRVESYLHGEGSIGVLLRLGADSKAAFSDGRVLGLAHDLALHVAAYRPLFLDEKSIPPAYREERLALVRNEVEEDPATKAKSAAIREGMVAGRLRKHYAAICLLGHGFVKDEGLSVAEVLERLRQETGYTIAVGDFTSFRAGEA